MNEKIAVSTLTRWVHPRVLWEGDEREERMTVASSPAGSNSQPRHGVCMPQGVVSVVIS